MQLSVLSCVSLVCVWGLLNKVIRVTVNQDIPHSPSNQGGSPVVSDTEYYFTCLLCIKSQLGAIVTSISDTLPTYAAFWALL